MSDKKISELTALTAPDGAEELVVNDSGTSKKITQANLLKGIDNSSADATAITIDASENVGIGTSSPDANLDVKDSSGGVIRVGTDTDNIGTDTAFGTLEFFNGDTSNSGPAVTAMIEAKTHPTNAYSTGGDIVFSNRSYPSSSLIEKVRFPSDGGITFNGDTAAANALDDYEEGDWDSEVGGTATYGVNQARYTKIGRQVIATFDLNITTIGTGSTTVVTGLPFAVGDSIAEGVSVSFFDGLATSVVFLTAYAINSEIRFRALTAAGTGLTDASVLGSGCRVTGTVSYTV